MTTKVRLRCDGNDVLMLISEKTALRMSWGNADELAAAIKSMARQAEENDKADQVIMDGALLARAGFPIGMTDDPRKMAEVAKEAVSNTALRRQVRPLRGVASTSIVGPPRLEMGSDFDALPLAKKAEVLRRRYPGLKIHER